MIGSKHSLLIRAKLLLIVTSISIDSLQMREYPSTNDQYLSYKLNDSRIDHLEELLREQNGSKFIVPLNEGRFDSKLLQVNMKAQVNIPLLHFEPVPSTTTSSLQSRNNGQSQVSNVNESRGLMEIGMTFAETEVTTMIAKEEIAETAKMTTTILTKQGSHYQSSRQKEFENFAKSGKNIYFKKPVDPSGPKSLDSTSSTPIETRLIKSSAGKEQKRSSRSAVPDSIVSTKALISTIRALIGHRLIIPCSSSNQTIAQAEQMASLRRQNQKVRANGNPIKAIANGQGISLIVWYKDDQLNSPIFTIDARGANSLREAKQQTNADTLRGRAHLEESTRLDSRGLGSTPALVIDSAIEQDAGIYTCTVEFYKAQTQTNQAKVELINPPNQMQVHDQSNQRLSSGIIGPYDEDTRLTLSCEVQPGQPPSHVSWWQLKSVSTLPLNRNTLKVPQIVRLNEEKTFEYMTTLSSDGSLDQSVQVQDYFVALHSAVQEPNLVLPFAEGSSLKHWAKVPDQITNNLDEKVQVSFQITLTRSYLNSEFICLARNNHFSAPLNFSVKIDMNLKPLEVKIVRRMENSFKLNQKVMIECQVHGSKPNANVKWFKGSKELEAKSASTSSLQNEELAQNHISEFNRDISNLTKVSYLTLIPQLSDNQQSLTCTANNPKMSNLESLSDSIIMNVQYPAQLSLQFGLNIKQDSIKLGSDVFMDCHIQSNPPIDDLIWLFNGRQLATNVSAGIIISNQSLVIQRIRIEHRGNYQCIAQNSLGRSLSNKLELSPNFEPMCDYATTKMKYEVPLNQATKIDCNVLAEPGDDIHFVWQFNQTSTPESDQTSGSFNRLDDVKQYETNLTHSHVIFTPKSRHNYGYYLCRASNSIGEQIKPCIIHVVPSELPDPVFGCFFDNLSNNSFSVHCQSQGSSNRQNYLLELYTNESIAGQQSDQDSTIPTTTTHLKQRQENQYLIEEEEQRQVKKISSDTPSFHITDLRPDTSYNLMIFVQNSKGRSPPAFYQASTLPVSDSAQAITGHVQLSNKRISTDSSIADKLISYLKVNEYMNSINMKPVVGIILVVLLCTLTFLIIIFAATRICRTTNQTNRRSRNSICPEPQDSKLSTYNPRDLKIEKNVQLKSADQLRLDGLAGSGSDTSRETNTDSTLISSSQTGAKSSTDKRRKQSNDLIDTISRNQQQFYLRNKNTTSPMIMSLNRQLETGAQQQTMQSLYSTIKRPIMNSPTDLDHSNTPQISVRSCESDCTSNNELQAVSQGFRDQLLLKCHDNISESVYVISRDGLSTGQCGEPQQIHLINSPNIWPYSEPAHHNNHNCGNNNGSTSAGTQVSSITTAESFTDQTNTADGAIYNRKVCQLVSEPRDIGDRLPLGFLPNSISIPVSLSDCIHKDSRRRLSQDFLNTDLCFANANESYLTLAPNDRFEYQHAPYSQCYDQQQPVNFHPGNHQQLVTSLSPPTDFEHDQYCKNSTVRIGNDQVQDSYHTLDESCRKPDYYSQCIDVHQESCDSSSGTCSRSNQQRQRHQVKFEPSNNPYKSSDECYK